MTTFSDSTLIGTHTAQDAAIVRTWGAAVLRPYMVVVELFFGGDGAADLLEVVVVARRGGAGLAGDPGAHAIGGFVHRGERGAAQVVVDERGGEGIAGADGVCDDDANAVVLIDFVGADEQAAF